MRSPCGSARASQRKRYGIGVKVSIVIYDQFGEPVYMYRMDGQAKVAIETAMMKAHTVVNTRQPSKATMNQVLSGRSSDVTAWLKNDQLTTAQALSKRAIVTLSCDRIGTLVAASPRRPGIVEVRDCRFLSTGG